ncbi:MAG: hypothetical protein ABI954_02575 [Pyrinomonadaceae bacterium]
MVFKVDGGGSVQRTQETVNKPEARINPVPQNNNHGLTNKIGELNFQAGALKSSLNRTVTAQKTASNPLSGVDLNKLSPGEALDKISKLPAISDINDKAAVRAYNEQRAALADAGIKNGVPPKVEDFRAAGLNGLTAGFEYLGAKFSYDSTISRLKGISETAKLKPTEAPIDAPLTPSQALERINGLPVPPPGDIAANRIYQQQRADIANAAVQSAVAPSRDDFRGLPPRLADLEYREAKSYFDGQVSQLRNIATDAQTRLTGPSQQEIDDAAARIWEAGEHNPEQGASQLTQEINALNAKYGPAASSQLMGKLYQDFKDDSYDHDLLNTLTFVGVNGSEADKNAVGTALGQAYDSMSAEDKQSFTDNLTREAELDSFRSNGLGFKSNQIADLVSRGSSDSFKQNMVSSLTKRMTEIQPGWLGNNNGVDVRALANSAAAIALSGSDKTSQVAMFNTIIKSLPEVTSDTFNSLIDEPGLKDSLSKLFINNSTEIMHSLTAENGRFRDAASADGLEKFFELAMFSKNPGAERENLMGSAVQLISQFADPSAAPTAGRDKAADAYVAGSLIGLVQTAALNQKDAIQDNQKTREDTVKMFTGMAFSFVPGAGKVLGEGSGKILELAYDKAKEFAQSHTESGLTSVINNLLDGDALENIDEGFKSIRDLRYTVAGTVLANNRELADSFELGYAATGVDQLFKKLFG